jgi:transcriptional regulator with XRE-family HTH domain
VTGAAARELRLAIGVRQTDLARELGVTIGSITSNERAAKLEPKTEARWLDALLKLAKVNGEARRRLQVAEMLSASGLD